MLTSIKVLKTFFEDGSADARPLGMGELKDLSSEERIELADMAAKVLGLEKVTVDGKTVYK